MSLQSASSSSIKRPHSSWNDFDFDEYRRRVYGEEIPDEDRRLICSCIELLTELAPCSQPITNYLDIGSGPNLYPAMLIKPWLDSSATISLLDYAAPNVSYLKSITGQRVSRDTLAEWMHFEQLMQSFGGDRYSGVLERLLSDANVGYGDIFALPQATYDAVSAFSVAESITDEVATFEVATRSLIRSVRPGGLIVAAHVIGSEGWYAGRHTQFPAVFLHERDLQRVYAGLSDLSITTFGHRHARLARKGHTGLALVVGRKQRLRDEDSQRGAC